MPDKKDLPLGIFDSGIGGLTVARAVFNKMPYEKILYFGDTGHLPYGNKSKKTIITLSDNIVEFLLSHNVKFIIVACNTASSLALDFLKKNYSIPIIGVIEPGAEAACKITGNNKVGVIGTYATVSSMAYDKAIHSINPEIKVYSKACPLFVSLVEEGWLKNDVTYKIARTYLQPLKKQGIDTLILGCTHYPLLKEVIRRVMGNDVHLVDSASEVAIKAQKMLNDLQIIKDTKKIPSHKFFVSDLLVQFKKMSRLFLNKEIYKIKLVSLD